MKLQKYPLKRSAVFHHCCFLKWQLVGSYVIHPILAETWNPPTPPPPPIHTHTPQLLPWTRDSLPSRWNSLAALRHADAAVGVLCQSPGQLWPHGCRRRADRCSTWPGSRARWTSLVVAAVIRVGGDSPGCHRQTTEQGSLSEGTSS